ncbi:hypothetical protein [Bradyrhizobium sp. dw_78]|uniref:hypothetical protein n=1 Tax=Bradyrhizobium sp. dw_78 TaxID=2719793 RepID=UPI001BD50382|nr:hypothetical protein [Bradyrhizobium sp. dw_78]
MKKPKQLKSTKLSPELEALKQSLLPKPPRNSSELEKRLFQAVLNKIECSTTDSGGLEFNYSKLTPEECFAIGVSNFDPPSVQEKTRDVWPRRPLVSYEGRALDVALQPTSSDLIVAEKRVRERARAEILSNIRGRQFQVGRTKGALSPINKFLFRLYTETSPHPTLEQLWKMLCNMVETRGQPDGDMVTLQEIDEDVLRYRDNKGTEKEIKKSTIQNALTGFKKSVP